MALRVVDNPDAPPEGGEEARAPRGSQAAGAVAAFFQEHALVAWVLVLALLLVLWFRGVDPLMGYFASLEEDAAELAKVETNYRGVLAREKAQLEETRRGHKELLERLGSDKPGDPAAQTSLLRRDVSALANGLGLMVHGTTPLPPVKEEGLTRLAVRLQAAGALSSVAAFLNAVGQSSQAMFVEKYKISPSKGDAQGRLDLDCQVALLKKAK